MTAHGRSNLQHIRITRGDPAAPDAKLGRETLQQPLILDELGHACFERFLALGLGVGALEERSPESIDLVFDALGMFNNLVRVVELLLLFFRVFVVGAVVVGNLYEPDPWR